MTIKSIFGILSLRHSDCKEIVGLFSIMQIIEISPVDISLITKIRYEIEKQTPPDYLSPSGYKLKQSPTALCELMNHLNTNEGV